MFSGSSLSGLGNAPALSGLGGAPSLGGMSGLGGAPSLGSKGSKTTSSSLTGLGGASLGLGGRGTVGGGFAAFDPDDVPDDYLLEDEDEIAALTGPVIGGIICSHHLHNHYALSPTLWMRCLINSDPGCTTGGLVSRGVA